MVAARYGSSPNVSGKRAQSGFSPSPRTGAKIQGMPAARVSLADTADDLYGKSTLNDAAIASACGNNVAP